MLMMGRLWKLVENGSRKETQRQMTGGVAIGGKMGMFEDLRWRRMHIRRI